jgi:3',5'-cyclic AMP phosphodiesterase CpdA
MTLRLLLTSDLHFGNYRSADAATRELANWVCEADADVLALAGDVADGPPDFFDACFGLFEDFEGLKLVTPGNHDLWAKGASSLERYRTIYPRIAADRGFAMLDEGPQVLGNTAFIGNIGWYDYSFRNPELGLPLEQYEAKEMPGVCTWNDGRFIDWPYTDAEFLEECIRRLKEHYAAVEADAEVVVAVLHHLPFRRLVPTGRPDKFAFAAAYMGAERLGEALLACPKVTDVYCGHSHWRAAADVGGINAVSVGCTNADKRLEVLDV